MTRTAPNTPQRTAEIIKEDFHAAKVEINPMIWKPLLRQAMTWDFSAARSQVSS